MTDRSGAPAGSVDFPTATICGSMRFADDMLVLAQELTAAGVVVLMPFVALAPADQGDALKAMLDRMHRQKIDAASTVYVVTDAGGYVGSSTRAEIRYTVAAGKPLQWWTRPVELEPTGWAAHR